MPVTVEADILGSLIVTTCLFFAGICGNTKPSNPTRKFQPPIASEDEEIRHTLEKASVGRQVLALPSFLEPFFRVTVEKYTKFLQRIIQAWNFFKANAIIVSMAKKQQEFDRMALSLHTMAES